MSNMSGLELDVAALKRSAWVFTIGGLIALIGMALAGKEFGAAAKKYVDQMPVPPAELAKQGFSQARNAVSASALAGAEAWRKSSVDHL